MKKITAVILSAVIIIVALLCSPVTVLGLKDDGFTDFNPDLGFSKEITMHNNNGTTNAESVSLYEGLPEPYLAGAMFKGWYLDEALTKPAKGDVTSTNVWAKWEATECNFDNAEAPYLAHSSDRYYVREHIGDSNSSALYCKETNSNYAWPDHLVLYNPDGTVYNTVANHEYSVRLLVKLDDWSKCTWTTIAVLRHSVNKAYEESSENGVYPGAYMSADGVTPARAVIKALYDDAVKRNGSGFDSYVYLNFRFKATGATPVYLMLRGMGSTFAIDNFSITDLTAQKNIVFGDKTVSGYAGDEITYPNSNGNMNVVGWKYDNGKIFNDTVFTKDVTLVPDYRNIAITNSDVKGGTLNFKLRFEGVTFKMNSSDVAKDYLGRVTVKQIGIGSILYPVVGVGVKVNGAEYSGISVKYSAAENNLLEVSIKNNTSNYSTEYKDIEGYIQYKDAFGEIKTITSKLSSNDIGVRQGVGLSYNAAADFGNGASVGYIDPTGKYTLTWYDEFDDNEWDYNKWGNGTQSTVRDNGSTLYNKNDRTHSYKNNGKLVLKSEYDAKNKTYLGVRAEPSYEFFHGYIESRMKMSEAYNSGSAFWLNNAGVFDDDPIKPTDESPAIYPEIDVVEVFDSVNHIYGITYHMWGYKDGVQEHRQLGAGAVKLPENLQADGTNRLCFKDFEDAEGYITVGFERTETQMNFYLHKNGVRTLIYSVTLKELQNITWGGTKIEKQSLFVNPVFLIFGQGAYELYEAAGTDPTGFNAVSYVDYVRIYE